MFLRQLPFVRERVIHRNDNYRRLLHTRVYYTDLYVFYYGITLRNRPREKIRVYNLFVSDQCILI